MSQGFPNWFAPSRAHGRATCCDYLGPLAGMGASSPSAANRCLRLDALRGETRIGRLCGRVRNQLAIGQPVGLLLGAGGKQRSPEASADVSVATMREVVEIAVAKSHRQAGIYISNPP